MLWLAFWSRLQAEKAPSASPTFTGTVTLAGGQLAFPAVQIPSSDPNTLDDYEEGTWTPTLTFATPGDLAVVYSIRTAAYTKIGRQIFLDFSVVTSSFTYTTASGGVEITGLPFTATSDANYNASGEIFWQGITKANFTHAVVNITTSSTFMGVIISGSGQTPAAIVTTDMPSLGTVRFRGCIDYRV